MSGFSSIQPNSVIQAAYGRARDLQGDKSNASSGTENAEAPTFAQMIEKGASEAVQTVREGDSVAAAGLSGQAGIQQVVEATMALESTVRVSVALRDKLVEAYQEVMRMPV
jgi:flagellar hook-basal body complex protein FliE